MAKTSGKKPAVKARPPGAAQTAPGKKLKRSRPETAKAATRNSVKAPAARLTAKPTAKAKSASATPTPSAKASNADSKKSDVHKLKSSQSLRSEAPAKGMSNPPKAAPVAARAALVVPKPVNVAIKPPPAAAPVVPANGKPVKNQAGFSVRDLDNFRELLLAKRRELIGDMSSMESEALRNNGGSNLSNLPIHMADMGTDNYEQEFTLGLVQKDRDLLKEINSALAKIKLGTYGICEATGLPITKERLEFQPWVRFSMEHQRKLERHGR